MGGDNIEQVYSGHYHLIVATISVRSGALLQQCQEGSEIRGGGTFRFLFVEGFFNRRQDDRSLERLEESLFRRWQERTCC